MSATFGPRVFCLLVCCYLLSVGFTSRKSCLRGHAVHLSTTSKFFYIFFSPSVIHLHIQKNNGTVSKPCYPLRSYGKFVCVLEGTWCVLWCVLFSNNWRAVCRPFMLTHITTIKSFLGLEICGLLGNYTAFGNYLPTFRDNVWVPSSPAKVPFLLGILTK
jgi:hypothetical protein